METWIPEETLERAIRSVGEKYRTAVMEMLTTGLNRDSLILHVSWALDLPRDDKRVDIARLNFVGGLRGAGLDVTGGRSGGDLYKIVGLKEPKETETSESWADYHREFLAKVQSLPRLTEADFEWFASGMKTRLTQRLFEESWLHFWSYMAGQRTPCYKVEGDGAAIIRQKNVAAPSFSIFQLDLAPNQLVNLVEMLGQISVNAVSVAFIRDQDRRMLENSFPDGSIKKMEEAIYDVRTFAEHPENFWNKTQRTGIRKRGREVTYCQVDGGSQAASDVITEWKRVNEGRQRQLAIHRDFVAAESTAPTKIQYIGFRDGIPVMTMIYDRLLTRDDMVAMIVEKGLNRAESPGGGYSMSDFNMFASCEMLLDLGIRWINGGAIYGGESGLADHKKHWASEVITLHSFTRGWGRKQIVPATK